MLYGEIARADIPPHFAPATGRLRHRVRIETKTRTADAAGGASVAWQELVTVWGEVAPLTAVQPLAGEQPQSTITHRVIIRWRDGVTHGARVIRKGTAGDRYLMVENVIDPDERRRYLLLDCAEVRDTV